MLLVTPSLVFLRGGRSRHSVHRHVHHVLYIDMYQTCTVYVMILGSAMILHLVIQLYSEVLIN